MDLVPPNRIARLLAAPLLLAAAGCGQGPLSTSGGAPSTAALGAVRSPAPVDCELRRAEALRAINAARASSRRCGIRTMAAAPPLRWSPQLLGAAEAHARDMAVQDYFEHRGPAGDSVRERVQAQNYSWRNVGENIAAGTESVEDTVTAWLESPAHCENLMEPDYQDVALACAQRPGTAFEIYWTLVLARK